MEVTYTNGDQLTITDEMKDAFNKDGYLIVRKLFCNEELQKMKKNYEDGEDYHKNKFMVKDKEGNESAQITWNFPGNDIFGMAARCEKLAGTCQQLLGGEVYHYHSKFVVKDPKTGGQRAWHQDYGYWYKNGCLFPDMMTVFVSIDTANKENGCLQVLEGSHRAGRVEHGLYGGEQGADVERVEELKKFCPLKYVEMNPGDALFFHCNLLHTSDINSSESRRLGFLPAYNRKSNDPVIDSHHPRYTPLDMVPNNAVLECENFTDLGGKGFLDMANLKSIKAQVQFNK
ncbi:L-proline trans-4-hydroxylase-like [Ruditapes philippinarum]|uniref:L-proline trans-4-hydroxylase-like n=1 Tax=Ruditapes philippinarum TaxID=129788 RepID=UPI00295A6527|nr:L-proline trans-4-hydroxylase-like [Ruditapes philippinarum]